MFRRAGAFLFWLFMPYAIAFFIMDVHRKMENAKSPWAEAVKTGQEITKTIRENRR